MQPNPMNQINFQDYSLSAIPSRDWKKITCFGLFTPKFSVLNDLVSSSGMHRNSILLSSAFLEQCCEILCVF